MPRFLATIRPVLSAVTEDYEVIFIADPCTDNTVELIRAEHERDPRIKLLLFSRRFGQPSATLGGLTYARGQAIIVIDCDRKLSAPRPRAPWQMGGPAVRMERS